VTPRGPCQPQPVCDFKHSTHRRRPRGSHVQLRSHPSVPAEARHAGYSTNTATASRLCAWSVLPPANILQLTLRWFFFFSQPTVENAPALRPHPARLWLAHALTSPTPRVQSKRREPSGSNRHCSQRKKNFS